MWGMIARIKTVAGMRDEMIALLRQSACDMPGCLSYVVATDTADGEVLWVTEVWESQARHDASLQLRQVQDAIPHARALVDSFERIALTHPVWCAGLEA